MELEIRDTLHIYPWQLDEVAKSLNKWWQQWQ
jgi:hypothetical protein